MLSCIEFIWNIYDSSYFYFRYPCIISALVLQLGNLHYGSATRRSGAAFAAFAVRGNHSFITVL